MERLQRLEISKGYVELLAEAEELRYDFAGFLEELRTLTKGSITARRLWREFHLNLARL